MGLLVDGQWHDEWYDTDKTGGKFEREAARFRNWVTVDGSPGPAGALRPRAGATTCMCLWPAPGRTGH